MADQAQIASSRITNCLISASLVGMLLCGLAQGSDWPTYRRNNARTGWTSDRLTLPLHAHWIYSAPAAPRMAWSGQEGANREGLVMVQRVKFDDVLHVAVAKQRVYFGSSIDHTLYCLRAADGSVAWSFCTGGPIRLAPTVAEDRVLFGSDDGNAYCLEAASGRLIWKVRPSPVDEWLLARGEMISRWPVRTGVLVDQGMAYFGAGIFPHENVYLCAADLRDGKILWKQDGISETSAGRSDLSPQGHLLINDQTLYVPSGGSLPAFVDRRTGEFLHKPGHAWRTDAGGPVGGSEALLCDGQLYSFGAHHILAMQQNTANVGFGWFAGQQMVVDQNSAYITTGEAVMRMDRKVYAEASRARHVIEIEIQQLNAKTPKTEEHQARLATLRKKVAELARSGVVWKMPRPGCSALVGAGDLVFIGGAGSVAALDIATGKEVWKGAVDGSARALAVANGNLWVSTTLGKIYCFAPKDAGPVASLVATAQADPYPADSQSSLYASAAEEILRHTGVKQGFCLVLGSERGRLAYELAKRSELKIYGIEPDAAKAEQSRRVLAATGMYGTRVTIHCAELDGIPYSNYFADLIVSDRLFSDEQLPAIADKIARHVKPCGGTVCLGRPGATSPGGLSDKTLSAWLKSMQLGGQGRIRTQGSWTILTRGLLPGAGSWTHQYAESGNSACSDDQCVRGDLGVLWYGDPGPAEMVNRHDSAVSPLAMEGRFFVQGQHKILAYDAYNGRFLWESADPGAIREGVKDGKNPGNLAGGDGRLFVVAKNVCRELDTASGRTLAAYPLPASIDRKTHVWQYVAYSKGLLIGTAVLREELADRARRSGQPVPSTQDVLFAIDLAAQKPLWTLSGHSIPPCTIALADERVFFIDSSLTDQQRAAMLRQDKTDLKKLTGDEARRAEQRQKKIDLRRAIAVAARTGQTLWSQPVDVTDCSEIGTGGGKLTLMHHDGVLVLCGANANGHYWPQFLAGEFKQRRLVALSAADGRLLWSKDANYRHRPIIIGQRLIAEPWDFDLHTGRQNTRTGALTGEPEPWCIMRTGHHCGALAACPHMITFRTGTMGYYDLDADVGVQHFGGQRPGCWINAIPANGLVIMPEASAGCVCLFSIEATTVLEPREPRRPWAIAASAGAKMPVRHLALNLGAPGDRRDAQGTLWLAYPRPKPYKETGLELDLDLKPKFLNGGRFMSVDSEDHDVPGTETPWLYTSWANGITALSIPLQEKNSAPARYHVKLCFADLSGAAPATRVFDVKMQGKMVAKVSLPSSGGNYGAATMHEVRDVEVIDTLSIELVPVSATPAGDQVPILNALEIRRDEP